VERADVSLTEFPTPAKAQARGHIECFDAQPLDPAGIGIYLDIEKTNPQKYNLQYQEGQVKFNQPLTKQSLPVDLVIHYHATNSFAMSKQEYREMYPTPKLIRESAELTLLQIPTEELWMIIEFPREYPIKDMYH